MKASVTSIRFYQLFAAVIFVLCIVDLQPASAQVLTESEPNDYFNEANPLPLNDTMKGITCAYPQRDIFRIILPADGTLKIVTSISANDSAPLPTIHADFFSHDSSNIVTEYAGVGANMIPVTDSFFISCLKADTFYINFNTPSFGFAYCFSYRFSCTLLPPPFASDSEPNDDFAHAKFASFNTNHDGHLAFSDEPGYHGDDDYYMIIPPSDGTLRVILQAEARRIRLSRCLLC